MTTVTLRPGLRALRTRPGRFLREDMSTDLQPQPAGFDRSRIRSLAPIAVFDIAGPLAVYYLARMAGTATVTALILSCFVSLLSGKPLMFRIVSETIGAGTPGGQFLQRAWDKPGARPLFARITAVWGVTYLAEVAFRVVILETFSTGPALTILKVTPYLATLILLSWSKQSIRRSPAFEGFLPASTSAGARPGTPGAAPQPGTPEPAARAERTAAAAPGTGPAPRPEPAMAGRSS
jgi:hypothetical protein